MAVTPVGNPYVESSDLVANYPGASEALAERIDIVGVNPFANAAARDAAIPSPVEGQMASLNDDDKVYRYSGSAWVEVGLPPGLNPVAPTSIANSGGSASTTGNTTTFTGVNSVSLNGVFSALYLSYSLNIIFTNSISNEIRLRYRSSGTDNTSSSYRQALVQGGGSVASSGASTVQTSIRLAYGTAGQPNMMGNISLQGPFATVSTGLSLIAFDGSTPNSYVTVTASGFVATTSFDGVTLYPNSGTITGTIQVFGYKN